MQLYSLDFFTPTRAESKTNFGNAFKALVWGWRELSLVGLSLFLLSACGGGGGSSGGSSLVKLIEADTNQITFEVDKQAGFNYEIYRNEQNSVSNEHYIDILREDQGSTYIDTGLDQGTSYFYWIKTCEGIDDCSDYSSVFNFTTRLVAPTQLSASTGTSQISLSWEIQDLNKVDYFEIYRNTQNSTSTSAIDTTSVTSYKDEAVDASSVYYYWVKACKEGGSCSDFSNGVETSLEITSATTLVAQLDGVREINLSWAVDGEVGYFEIYRNTEDDNTGLSPIANASTVSYSDSTLTASTRYYYWVKACQGGGNCSDFSTVANARTPAAAPTELSASAVGLLRQIDLSWMVEGEVDYFELYRHNEDFNTGLTPLVDDQTDTSYSDNALEASSVYYYWVKACQSGGECSDFSSSANAETQAGVFSRVEAQAESISSIRLSWEAQGEFDYVEIHRSKANDRNTATNVETPNPLTFSGVYINTNLEMNTDYYYWLRACQSGGDCSGFSSGVTARTHLAARGNLNDTGIIEKALDYDDSAGGRDAQYLTGGLVKKGAGWAGFDFTKLGKDGSVLAIQNQAWQEGGSEQEGTQWSCVVDNVTGLYWEVKTNKEDDIHFKRNVYRWGGITSEGIGDPNRQGNYYDDWDDLVNGSNSEQLCGFGDWRVPNLSELNSLVNKSTRSYSLDRAYFPNGDQGLADYWTASPHLPNRDHAWHVSFNFGDASEPLSLSPSIVRDTELYVRLVRSTKYGFRGEPLTYIPNRTPDTRERDTRYIFKENRDGLYESLGAWGVIIDLQTSLMWKYCTEGGAYEYSFSNSRPTCKDADYKKYTWSDALERVTAANEFRATGYAGHQDWRLPNIKELQSIVAYDRYGPTVARGRYNFYNTPVGWFWSSTVYPHRKGGELKALAISFDNGREEAHGRVGNSQGYVRLVRDYQPSQ